MQYYRMLTDVDAPKRWHLASPINSESGEEVDSRIFTYGELADPVAPLRIPLRCLGEGLDITYADFHMPVITQAVAEVFEREVGDDTQLIPIAVEGCKGAYFILNVISVLDCLDRDTSVVQWWTPADGRPDKVGEPRMVVELLIDPEQVDGQQIFRIEKWEVAVIVAERIKVLLEAMQVTGVKFEGV